MNGRRKDIIDYIRQLPLLIVQRVGILDKLPQGEQTCLTRFGMAVAVILVRFRAALEFIR